MDRLRNDALADQARIEREAKLEENAGLCRWLGIEPRAWRTGALLTKHKERAEAAGKAVGLAIEPHYPALDTREGFWLLWDALQNPEFGNWIMTKLGRGKASVAYSVVCELIRKPGEFVGEVLAEGEGSTPEAALYAAAVALWRREGASE